jgi:hypothetical protein
MAVKKFLDQGNLQYLLERLVEIIDQKTQINIVNDIDENSTNQQIPGAKAVYDLLTAALAGIIKLTMEVVQALPATGESNVIYLVKADADTYKQWIYSDDQWFDLGDIDVDLSDYWAKDELEALTNQEVQDIIDEVMGV